MSADKINIVEDLQWNAYKDNVDKKERFLRSTWRKEIKESKKSDSKEELLFKTAEVNEESKVALQNTIKKKKKKQDHLKKKTKKLKLKIKSRKEKIEFLKIDSKIHSSRDKKSHSLSPKGKKSPNKTVDNLNAKDDCIFSINPFVFQDTSEFDESSVLQYEIVSYKNKINSINKCKNNFYSFYLYDKMRYNKLLPPESYVGRFIIVNQLIAKIHKTEGDFLIFSYLDSSHKNVIIKCDDYDIHLIEYVFSYQGKIKQFEQNRHKLSFKLVNDEIENTYAFIVSKFHTDSKKRQLLIKQHKDYHINKKYEYSGFITNSSVKFSDIILLDCGLLDQLEIGYPFVIETPNVFLEINNLYQTFLNNVENTIILTREKIDQLINEKKREDTIDTQIDLNKFILHEIKITKRNEDKILTKMCLLLQYNNLLKNVYVRDLKTGKCEWVRLKDKLNSRETNNDLMDTIMLYSNQQIFVDNITINTLKGPTLIKSFINYVAQSSTDFYTLVTFKINEEISLDAEAEFYDAIIINKNIGEIKTVVSEIECNKCTYKIGEFDYRICKFCSKVYHIECLLPQERKNSNNILDKCWSCQACRPCSNCKTTNTNSEVIYSDKVYCRECISCYHLSCINPYIREVYPVFSTSDQDKWKCENCIKCATCALTCEDAIIKKITFSKNYDDCSDCSKKFEKKEYCPICKKLWHQDGETMIECKCKFWVHKNCDRILTEEHYNRLTKKTKIYHCPMCRIKKKNKQLRSILIELYKTDKTGIFYYPVDTKVIKNYSKIIKKPMCFYYMSQKLEKNLYLQEIEELASDLSLIFTNAMTYNMPNTNIYKLAEQTHQSCSTLIENRSSDLFYYSFEYYLFDYNNENCLYSSDPEKHMKIIENLIRSKFSAKIELLKPKLVSIQNKLIEYQINWPFMTEFLEKNFNLINMNNNVINENGDETYSIASDGYLAHDDSKVLNCSKSDNISSEEGNIMNIEEAEENSINKVFNPNLSISTILKSNEVNINNIELAPQIKAGAVSSDNSPNNIKEETLKISFPNPISEENEKCNNDQIVNKIKPNSDSPQKFQITINSDINEINNFGLIIPNEFDNIKIEQPSDKEFQNKKRDRMKPKIIKTSDFQKELDTYNSNFEISKKSSKNQSNSNTNHKMEIIENSVDLFNPFLALEEEEENILTACDKIKSTDHKICFLYPSKYKSYLNYNGNDKEEFSSFIDMLSSYVFMKDDKKKKNTQTEDNKKRIKLSKNSPISNDVSVVDNDDVYEVPEEIHMKNKKGRPSKKNKNKTTMRHKALKSSLNSNKLKPLLMPQLGNQNHHNANSSHSTLTSGKIQLNKGTVPSKNDFTTTNPVNNKISYTNDSNRFKTEAELFEENINKRNLLPFPAQVCFSSVDLIFEKNCYLCGSFDDTPLFLTCSICFENFHSYCISNSPMLTQNIDNIKNYKWKCQNCKFCECCMQNGNDHLLLYCDSCDRALHTYCLEVKLHVVPVSGWKCLSCFKCQNCSTTKYYKQTFPINTSKDYSIFTRNFNYCFECGLALMYYSFCTKCQKSDFKNFNKTLIFIKNIEDYKKSEHLLNFDFCGNSALLRTIEKDHILMLNCSICEQWFHSDCLGIDDINLKYYFESYDTFNCLDCHIIKKYNERYLEVTFIKYLDVLKMSYTVMCFSKLIMIILKSICRDSNIKLHSKLLKLYLKENFNTLLKDRNMCMMLELIRMDVFLVKDEKLKKKKDENNLNENESENKQRITPFDINNLALTDKISEIIPLNNLNEEKEKDKKSDHEYITDLLRKVDKIKKTEQLKNIKMDSNYLSRIMRRQDLEKCRKLAVKAKRRSSLYDINISNNKNPFEIKNSKSLSKSVTHDCNILISKCMAVKKKTSDTNFHNSSYNSKLSSNNNMMFDEQYTEKDNDNIINEEVNNKDNNLKLPNVNEHQSRKLEISDFQCNPLQSEKKKRKRLSLIPDKQFKKELETFFKKNSGEEIKNLNTFENTKFVNFYNFDLDSYYKSGEGYQKSKTTANTNEISNLDGNQLITETINKLERYLKLTTFSKRIRKFIFNLILTTILTLKQSLLKWLINQMMSTNDNTYNYMQKNNIYQYWINFQSSNSMTEIFSENTSSNNANEFSEEEITKFIDLIDPIQDSPSRNIQCEFCLRKGCRKFSGRLLHIRNESWGHINCMLWSKGIQESTEGSLLNVCQMLNKVRLFKCHFCRKYGATISCESRKCGKNYHFSCAHAKQCVFTQKKQFFCNKCAVGSGNTKDENFANFNTHRRFIVVKNPEFVNDYKLSNISITNSDNAGNQNPFLILPRYLIGSYNKFGNTTVLKFFQIKKDLSYDLIDIGIVKYIDKQDYYTLKNINNLEKTNDYLFLFLLNNSGVHFSSLMFDKQGVKEFEEFLGKLKLLNCTEKTEVDVELLKYHSKYEPITKSFDMNLYLNNYNNSKDKFEFNSNINLKRFNSQLEEFIKNFIISEEEAENMKQINKNYSDWMSFFNISIPFNIILKYQSLYLKMTTEYSDNLTSSSYQNDILELRNKKESRSKLERFVSIIKSKNNTNGQNCFKFLNYIEHHQNKIFKRSQAEQDMDTNNYLGSDKRITKMNKQTYKNLNRTMNTNIMDMDLPLAMKFRNYKSLKPKVTIGPSTIHRNGLFTTEAFQPGEIVIEYVGELISNKIADFREKEYNLKGFGDCYMFRLDQNHIIDATKYGNLARFINHCCDPNCSAQANQIGDKKHIILYAKRHIKPNEEITYDYNFECEQEKIQCRCGAKNCQGRLN